MASHTHTPKPVVNIKVIKNKYMYLIHFETVLYMYKILRTFSQTYLP